MRLPQLFLPNLSKEQKDFLTLLDLTAKVHGESLAPASGSAAPIWREDFFHLSASSAWQQFSSTLQDEILIVLSQKLLQEAFFIETAGMAYAGRMNLAARTKEERAFFCFVAEEEAKHLRLIESLGTFETSLDRIPSFSLLIGEIIQEATKPCHLLLIQILLEGWGLNYYRSLAKSATIESVASVFRAILKDEIRHHSAGVLLFSEQRERQGLSTEDANLFLHYLERIGHMVKIGPYVVCEEIFTRSQDKTREALRKFLEESEAVLLTAGKLELISNLLSKSLPEDLLQEIQDRKILHPLGLNEMTELLFQAMPEIFQQP